MRKVRLFLVILILFFTFPHDGSIAHSISSRPALHKASTQRALDDDSELKLHRIIGSIMAGDDPKLLSKLADFLEVYDEIKVHYVDDKSTDDLMNLAMKGMVSGLDPYSNLFIDKEAQAVIQRFSETNYTGGVGMTINRFDKDLYITEVYEGYSAYKAGIEPGDILTKVNGQSIYGMSVEQVIDLVRGKQGTTVSVEMKGPRFQKPVTYTLMRENVNISSVASKPEGNNGYIKVRSFLPETPKRFYDAVRAFRNKDGLIIDLRNNRGGSLEAVIDMVATFVGPGKAVISSKGQTANKTYNTRNSYGAGMKYPKKVVVLVNNFSASASEIMAGDLQYYKVATIMGVRTYGKATVQDYLDLDTDDHSVSERTRLLMGITTARYFLPDGRNITETGIVTDIEVEQLENFRIYEYGTKRDAQFQAAVAFLAKQ